MKISAINKRIDDELKLIEKDIIDINESLDMIDDAGLPKPYDGVLSLGLRKRKDFRNKMRNLLMDIKADIERLEKEIKEIKSKSGAYGDVLKEILKK